MSQLSLSFRPSFVSDKPKLESFTYLYSEITRVLVPKVLKALGSLGKKLDFFHPFGFVILGDFENEI